MKTRILLLVSFFSFITLGMPDGMLGVAWPSISSSFDVPIGNLGILMFGFTIGYVTTTALLGTIIARLGYAKVMTTASASLTVGALGMFVAPSWIFVILSMTAIGIGSGLLDGGLNAYGAGNFRPRDLNWLHAFYGIGATIGPAIMTPMILTDIGWHGGYGFVTVVSTVVLGAFIWTRSSWNTGEPPDEPRRGGNASENASQDAPKGEAPKREGSKGESGLFTSPRATLISVGSVLLFFLYTGIEVVAGQWAFSLFTIERGVSPGRAGTWVGIYWASMTVGRIIFGWVSERVPVATILRSVLLTSGAGIVALFFQTPAWIAPIGLSLLGFSLAPMFPLLIGETPKRIGKRVADHLIGFQIAAANIGAVALVGAVGFGVERYGFELVPIALVVAFIIFSVLHEVLFILAPPQ